MSDPLLVDQIKIQPGATGDRRIAKDSSTQSLLFTDPVAGSLTLSDLVGLHKAGSLYLVGPSSPAVYTSIQTAFDAIPVSASKLSPALVLLLPGVYAEQLTLEKDGVILASLGGGATIKAPSSGSTITLQQGGASTPKYFRMESVRLENEYDGQACLELAGGSGSEIGEDGIEIIDCDLVASGVGGFQISTDTINKLHVHGGSWAESSASSICLVQQTAELILSSVTGIVNSQLVYDQSQPAPSIVTSTYQYDSCFMTGNVLVSLDGDGSLEMSTCKIGNLTCNGDRSILVENSTLGNIVLNDTVAASMRSCVRGSASGTGTLAESIQTGSVAFVASATETVVFPVSQPDANYVVHPETELTEAIAVQSKTNASFDLSFSGVQTTSVSYAVIRTQF